MQQPGPADRGVTFRLHDDEPVGLGGVRVKFDDERVVSDAGVMLVATLAEQLGIEPLAGRLVRLRCDRPGAANAGRKVMTLLFAMVLARSAQAARCSRVVVGERRREDRERSSVAQSVVVDVTVDVVNFEAFGRAADDAAFAVLVDKLAA